MILMDDESSKFIKEIKLHLHQGDLIRQKFDIKLDSRSGLAFEKVVEEFQLETRRWLDCSVAMLNAINPDLVTKYEKRLPVSAVSSPKEKAESLRQRLMHGYTELQSAVYSIQYIPPQEVVSNDKAKKDLDLTEVFLVHGRNSVTRSKVKDQLHEWDLRVTTLAAKPGTLTLAEELEDKASSAGYAVVLATPDDEGRTKEDFRGKNETDDLNPRARENVVYELGWFHSRLGRDRVCVVTVDHQEIVPSDLKGTKVVSLDRDDWREQLRRNLLAADMKAS